MKKCRFCGFTKIIKYGTRTAKRKQEMAHKKSKSPSKPQISINTYIMGAGAFIILILIWMYYNPTSTGTMPFGDKIISIILGVIYITLALLVLLVAIIVAKFLLNKKFFLNKK